MHMMNATDIRDIRLCIKKWAQMILDEIIPNQNIEEVFSEIIGKDYHSLPMIDWPDKAAHNSYFIDTDVWGLEGIHTAIYVCLKSLFRQYKEKHNL